MAQVQIVIVPYDRQDYAYLAWQAQNVTIAASAVVRLGGRSYPQPCTTDGNCRLFRFHRCR